MATYRYNVVVEVSIETDRMNAGRRAQQENLRSMEREAAQSGERMTNDLIAENRRQQKITDDHLNYKINNVKSHNQAMLDEQNRQADSIIGAMLREQAEINRLQQETIENQRTNNRQSVADAMDTAKRRVEARSYEANQVELLNDRIRRSDPFQSLGGRNQGLGQASNSIRAAQINDDTVRGANRNRITSDFADENIRRNMANIHNVLQTQEIADADRNIRRLTQTTNEGARSLGMWGQAFKGAFIGAVAGIVFSTIIGGITGLISKTAELGVEGVELAANFEMTKNSLTLFAGSARVASEQLDLVDQAAKDTPGLKLEDAEVGTSRLKALNFEFDTALNLTKGIAKQKLISGVQDETAVNRVVVNLQQLRAGSPQIQRDIQQMVLSIPSLSLVINQAFGSIQKFKKAIQENPNAALDKFAKAMADAEIPATGLANQWEKLVDEFTLSKREFGEPLLEPLTESFRLLTEYLTSNMVTWRQWGQVVADVIEGINQPNPDVPSPSEKTPGFSGLLFGTLARNPELIGKAATSGVAQESYFQKYLGFKEEDRDFLGFYDRTTRAERLGREARLKREQNGFQQKFDALNTNTPEDLAQSVYGVSNVQRNKLLRGDNTIDLSVLYDPTGGIKKKADEKAQREAFEEAERQRKNNLEKIDAYYSQVKSIRQSAFEIEVAQNQDNAQKVFEINDKNYQGQIKDAQNFYDEKLKLTDGSAGEIYKLEVERNNTLRELDSKRQIAQINFDREQERKRRENLIEANDLMRQEIEQNYNKRIQQTEKFIQLETVSIDAGYDEILDLTQRQANLVSQKVRDEYALRLSDKSLTDQQIINLTKQRDLELERIATDTAQKTLEIEQKRYEAQMALITKEGERRKEIIQSNIESFDSLGSILSPAFSQTGEVQTIFRAYNQIRDEGLKGLNEDISKRQNYLTEQKTLLSQLEKDAATAKQALDAFDNQQVEVDKIQEFSDNRTKAKTKFDELDNNLIKTKGIISQTEKEIGRLKTRAEDALTGTFPTIAADLQGLYDKISQTGDYTIFDQIIEKSYQAKRALERDLLKVEVDTLSQQLTTTRQQVDKGTVAPSVANDLELKLNLATRRLANFDLQTKIGNAELETRTNLLAQVNKLLEGDKTALASLKWQAETNRIKEYNGILQETILLETGYYRDTTLLALNRRKQIAEANQSIWESQQKIPEQMVFTREKADANLMEFLASQKGLTEIFSDARINLITKSFDGLDKVAASLAKNFGFAKDMVKELISGLLKLAANQIFTKLFGFSPFGGGSGGIGGTPNFNPNGGNGGFNFGSFLNGNSGGNNGGGFSFPNIFGGGNGGGTPTADGGISFPGLGPFKPPTGGGAAGATSGIGGIAKGSGFLSGLGGLAPLLGLSLGSKLGGGKGLGGIVGGLGGLLAGGSAAAFLAPSLFGVGTAAGSSPFAAAAFGFLTNPFTIAAGVALLAGAVIIGKNAARRRDEKTRNQAMVDAFASLDKLIEQVNNDQIDGNQALEQADSIRKQYLESMSQLKDKKTREIALKDVSRIDAKIEQIKIATASQTARRQRLELFAPTFADGGELSKFANDHYRNNPLGYQRGGQKLGYFPASNQYAIYNEKGSEYIFDAETTRNVGVDKLDLIRHTKGNVLNSMLFRWGDVQRKADGGPLTMIQATAPASSGQTATATEPAQIHIHVDGTPFGEIIAQALTFIIQENDGSSKQINAIGNGLENQGQAKMVELIAEKVMEKLGLK